MATGRNDAGLNIDITASGANAKAEISGVHKAIQDLAGGPVVALQHGFHTAATELSSLAGVYTGNRLSGVTTQITELAEATGKIPGGVGLAIGAIAALGLVTFEVGEHLFKMAEHAAETGESFKKFQSITGFSAEAVSTLDYYAKLTGKTLEDMAIPLSKFGKLVQESINDPTGKAAQTLHNAHVTSTDLTVALDQATKHMESLGEGTARTTEDMELFGGRGVKVVIPLMDKMKGGFLEAIANAKELGLTLTQEDIEAAEAFGKTLKTVEAQLGLAADRFALAYGPVITDTLQSISRFLAENKDTWAAWGHDVGTAITLVVDEAKALEYAGESLMSAFNSFFRTSISGWTVWAASLRVILAGATFGISELAIATAQMMNLMLPLQGAAGGTVGLGVIKQPQTGGPKGGGGGKGGGGKSRDTAKEDLQAHIADEKLLLGEFEKDYKNTMERIRAEFKKTGDDNVFRAAIKKAQDLLDSQINPILDLLEKLEKQNLKDPTPFQAKHLADEQAKRRHELADARLKDNEKSNKEIEDSDEKYAKAVKKINDDLWKLQEETAKQVGEYLIQQTDAAADAAIEADQRVLQNVHATAPERQAAFDDIVHQTAKRAGILRNQEETDYERSVTNILRERAIRKKEIEDTLKDEDEKNADLEALDNDTNIRIEQAHEKHAKRLQEIDKGTALPAVSRVPGAAESGFMGGLNTGQLADLADGVQSFADVTTTAFSAAGAAVNGLAEGFGSMLESLILMGSAGPNAVQKMTASVLAGVAKQAAVLSIFHLAKAIGELFWDPPAAALDFTAAELFGSIALITGVAGHFVAGNAFKQQTANGGAGATSSGQASLNSTDITSANNPLNRFTETVTIQLAKMQSRTDAVLGGVMDTLDDFNNKFNVATPGHVVIAGLNQYPDAAFNAVTSVLGSGARPTEDMIRAQGRYR